MNVVAIHWQSIALVIAMIALGIWSVASMPVEERSQDTRETVRQLLLEVRRPGVAAQMVTVPTDALLGRGRECHIHFDDATVSKQHARLRLVDNRAVLEDLQSTNGTTLNGRLIAGAAPLRRGDRIGLGPNLIVFVGLSAPSRNQQR